MAGVSLRGTVEKREKESVYLKLDINGADGTAPALNPPYLPEQYTEYPAAVQGWAQQALPGGGSGIESGLDSVDDIFTAGKKTFDNFDINNAYVKPKHLSTTGGNGQKFIGASKAETESILKDALSNGKIVSISDNGLTKVGNASYEIVIDAGKIVGTKGENLVKIVISSDGGMLSAYPIK